MFQVLDDDVRRCNIAEKLWTGFDGNRSKYSSFDDIYFRANIRDVFYWKGFCLKCRRSMLRIITNENTMDMILSPSVMIHSR